MTSQRTARLLSTELREDHQRLDGLFQSLAANAESGDYRVLGSSWTALEEGLLAHIDAEEAFMLPAFDRIDPPEASAIRLEHARIRRLVAEIGVRLELHALTTEGIRQFVEYLRTHAAREEAIFYRWVDRELEESSASLVRDHLAFIRARAERVDREIVQELKRLRTLRDELRAQAHLARAELRDRFEKLEPVWHKVELQSQKLQASAEQGVRKLIEDLRSSYQELKASLTHR